MGIPVDVGDVREIGVDPETVEVGYKRHHPHYDGNAFHEKFLSTTYPHIWSFDLFLDYYLNEIPKTLDSVFVDASQDAGKVELDHTHNPSEYLRICVSRIEIGRPRRTDNEGNGTADPRMFPRHARVSHVSYSAPMYVTYVYNNTSAKKVKELRVFSGLVPVMVRSKACHLRELNAFEVCRYAGEDQNEPGGYFIVNGNERAVRFVIQQRCNYPIAIKKARLATRDIFFTEYAVIFRGARTDGTSTNNVLFFTEDRQCVFRILLNRSEWTCPFWVLLKALFPTLHNDMIKSKLLEGTDDDIELQQEIQMLWTTMVDPEPLNTDVDFFEDRYLSILGTYFLDGVRGRLPPGSGKSAAGRHVIDHYVLVHTSNWIGKFETLILMWKKLWAVARGKIPAENVDSFAFQELLGPGQLYASVLKDALFNSLFQVRLGYLTEIREASAAGDDPVSVIRSDSLFESIVKRSCQGPARALSFFLATGNIRTFQLDLQQTAGWTITADRLNMNRFISHFRAVHRGQFFTKMRTTEARKLVGETWGFVCPVHTPDGPSCGLLLHLGQDAMVVSDPTDTGFRSAVTDLLETWGFKTNRVGRLMAPSPPHTQTFPVVVDGEPVVRIPCSQYHEVYNILRDAKRDGKHRIPQQVELCGFDRNSGAMEAIYIFSGPCRLVRPVRDIKTGKVEWIGPLAQPWLQIACSQKDVDDMKTARKLQQKIMDAMKELGPDKAIQKVDNSSLQAMVAAYTDSLKADPTKASERIGKMLKSAGINQKLLTDETQLIQNCPVDYQYVEVHPTSFLSINASFTPLSNHNQSPRNMYQCQMLKQTMGTPYHNLAYRIDNKVYRTLTPNRPLVRNHDYKRYDMDPYASGTNAVVAVIAYTGFDMEDAMIINKHAMERGLFDGCVYKTKVVEAAPTGTRMVDARHFVFSNSSASQRKWEPLLELDGFPAIGTRLVRDSPLYRTEDLRLKSADGNDDVDGRAGHVSTYHDDEEAFVDKIVLINPDGERHNKYAAPVFCQRAIITLRCIRRPIIGDKFASRAGQKGILSLLYPPEDMPFSPSGIVPDIVFNPHGFPSRMTVGMVIESMAGKAACLTGKYQDSTPFVEYPRQTEIDRSNRWIDQGGYNGWERRGQKYMTDEENDAQVTDNPVDYFGKLLLNNGYQYFGCESLYSGIAGVEMTCQIFIGIIYYQRLRHMVSDKWQCRSIGPIDHLTRQPLKGRKRGGGVRLGEMERDALLGHGASFVLQDRLLNCSDGHMAHVCPKCGSILSPCLDNNRVRATGGTKNIPICRVCSVPCRQIFIPYVFRYISNELAAMNISIKLHLTECDREVTVDDSKALHSESLSAHFADLIEEIDVLPTEQPVPTEKKDDVKTEMKD